MLEKERVEEILTVQHKLSGNENWRNVADVEIKEISNFLVFLIKGLEQNQSYDVRVLASKRSEDGCNRFLLFETKNEIVLSKFNRSNCVRTLNLCQESLSLVSGGDRGEKSSGVRLFLGEQLRFKNS